MQLELSFFIAFSNNNDNIEIQDFTLYVVMMNNNIFDKRI